MIVCKLLNRLWVTGHSGRSYHSLTHSLTYLLTYSLTYLLTCQAKRHHASLLTRLSQLLDGEHINAFPQDPAVVLLDVPEMIRGGGGEIGWVEGWFHGFK